jgi:predicted methyltransferase MtxX (methanogen marker protein 4)
MIMLHSEQENCPPAVSMTPTAVPQAKVAGRQPEKLSSKEQQVEKEEEVKVEVVKTDDIQRFYDDLMKQTLIPSAVSGASGGSGNNNEILKETLDESNLSAMY